MMYEKEADQIKKKVEAMEQDPNKDEYMVKKQVCIIMLIIWIVLCIVCMIYYNQCMILPNWC